MFPKMMTQMNFSKLMDTQNGNNFYQMFYDIAVGSGRPLTNYKLQDDIAFEFAGRLKIQEQQNLLTSMWKPYLKIWTRCIRM